MPNSYVLHTANGSATQFSISAIDGWIDSGFLKVYLNNVLQTTGFSFVDMTTVTPKVQFTVAPSNGVVVRVQRETPDTVTSFRSNIVDFNDGSVLTAADLDRMVEGVVHISQESKDLVGEALGETLDGTQWDGENRRITNLANGTGAQDAATVGQLTGLSLYGEILGTPQAWEFTGTGSQQSFWLTSPAPYSTSKEMYLVEVNGSILMPSAYNIVDVLGLPYLQFTVAPANAAVIRVRNLGANRTASITVLTSNLDNGAVTEPKIATGAVTSSKIATGGVTSTQLGTNSVTTVKIADGAVTGSKIADGAVIASKIPDGSIAASKLVAETITGDKIASGAVNTVELANNAVTFAKMQTVGTNVVLGNDNSGTAVQEIACTQAGRDLIGAADLNAQKTLLGISGTGGGLITNADVDSNAAIAFSKLATMPLYHLLGNNSGSTATPSSVTASAFTMNLLQNAGASTWRDALGLTRGLDFIPSSATVDPTTLTAGELKFYYVNLSETLTFNSGTTTSTGYFFGVKGATAELVVGYWNGTFITYLTIPGGGASNTFATTSGSVVVANSTSTALGFCVVQRIS